jgi:hypothetical protein
MLNELLVNIVDTPIMTTKATALKLLQLHSNLALLTNKLLSNNWSSLSFGLRLVGMSLHMPKKMLI